MKNVLSNIFALGLLVTAVGYSAPTVKTAKDAAKALPGAGSTKDVAKEDKKVNPIVNNVLNQILSARLSAGGAFKVKKRKVGDETKTTFEIADFELDAVVPFKDGFDYRFGAEPKPENPVKDVIPYINFNTKNMTVVVRAEIKEKGTMTVMFCHNYSVNNGFCDTQDDTRLLQVVLKSKSLSEMFRVHLKDITIKFDKKIDGGKFSFTGTCNAFKSGIDDAVKPTMKKVDCSFNGDFDSEAGTQDFGFKFK